MRADIANKEAGTADKPGLLPWQPWKGLAVGIGAGAGPMAVSVGWMTVVVPAISGH